MTALFLFSCFQLTLMIAFSCLADIDLPKGFVWGKRGFFLFVTIVCWLTVIAFFIVFLLGLDKKLKKVPFKIIVRQQNTDNGWNRIDFRSLPHSPIRQFHEPLDNQTWQTEWKTVPLSKMLVYECENQTLQAFVSAVCMPSLIHQWPPQLFNFSYCAWLLIVFLKI